MPPRPAPRIPLTALALLTAGCAHGATTTALPGVEVITLRRAYANAHAVRTPAGTLLVDAGLAAEQPALEAELRAAGVDPAQLRLLALTHGHADHAGAAAGLRADHGVPVLAGAGDLPLLEAGHNDRLCPTDAMARGLVSDAQAEVYPGLRPDHPIDGPVDLAAFGLPGRAWPVGAHTEGSVVVEVGPALFVGDLLRGSLLGASATTHFFQCDPAAARAVIAGLLRESDATVWFVGHFGPLSRDEVAAFVDGG